VRPEAHDQANRVSAADIDGVLPPAEDGRGRRAVDVEHLELDVVDMERVRQAVGVLDLPDLRRPGGHRGVDPAHVHVASVDLRARQPEVASLDGVARVDAVDGDERLGNRG
jgi:hypothetical protein